MPPDEGGESDGNKNGEATSTTEAPSGGQKVKRQAKEEQIFTQLGPQAKLYIACTWSTDCIDAKTRQYGHTASCLWFFKPTR